MKVTANDGTASVSDEFDITVVALPVITITGPSAAVTEGTAATFTVTATPAPTGNLTVNVTVSEPEGSDFVAAGDEGAKTVTVTSGATSAAFTVDTVGDSTFESDGSVTVTVTTGTGYVVGTTASASVAVSDNDPLISNLGRGNTSSIGLGSVDAAQEFTTGASPAGYTLDSVVANFTSTPSGLSVYIATGLPSATNVVATLANPDTLGTGTHTSSPCPRTRSCRPARCIGWSSRRQRGTSAVRTLATRMQAGPTAGVSATTVASGRPGRPPGRGTTSTSALSISPFTARWWWTRIRRRLLRRR